MTRQDDAVVAILDRLRILATQLGVAVTRQDATATNAVCVQMIPLVDILDKLQIPGAGPDLYKLRKHVDFPNKYAPRGEWARIAQDPPDCIHDIAAITSKLVRVSSADPWWELIHPSIRKVAESRCAAGHMADAVEAALKEVNNRVKRKYRGKAKSKKVPDGTGLMFQAFPLPRPRIRLADLTTQSGRDEQEGYMHLFAGAMLALRDPKAHDNINIDEDRARHHLFVASLLMSKLDEANVPP